MAANAPKRPPKLKALEARAFHVSARSRVASADRPSCAACSPASVLPSRGTKALHAHQLTTAVTATATPLIVSFRVSALNNSRGDGGFSRLAAVIHCVLSRTNILMSNARITGARPARNTYRHEVWGVEANHTPAI